MRLAYNPALDGIRAFAVLLVLVFHSHGPWLPGGYIGVDIFFVLSGYLITSILLAERRRTGAISFRRFYIRRFLRLTPALLFLLAAVLLAGPMLFPERRNALALEAALAGLYVSDYTRAFFYVPAILAHTWSLSVEEHFYLLWPAAVAILSRWRHGSWLLIALFAVGTLWRLAAYGASGDWHNVYHRFDTRLTGLTLGALLAWRPLRLRRQAADWLGGVTFLMLAVAAAGWSWDDPGFLTWGLTTVELAALGLLLSAVTPGSLVHRSFAVRPAIYVGRISYGIYLWHYPAMVYLREGAGPGAALIWGTAFAVVMAMISYHTVERVARRLATASER